MENLEILEKLVSIKSFENCDEIIDFLKNYFETKVVEIKILENEKDKKSIIIGINSKLKDIQPIVLSGHVDTVLADIQGYQTNPYELTIKDGKAYGLGVIDMKCFTASIIDKLDELKNISVPIVVALTTDEETTFSCIKDVIKFFKAQNITPNFTIVGEPTKFQLMTKSNGCYEYSLEVFGKSAHSSMVNKGVNAINILAKIITFIEQEQKCYKNLTSNCGIVSGGDIVNRVPDYSKLSFDIRTTNLNEQEKFLQRIIDFSSQLKKEYRAKIKLTKKFEILPMQCFDNNMIENFAKKFGLKIKTFTGSCEAGYYESLGSPIIIFGAGDLSLAHKANEYLVIEDYYTYNDLLISMLKQIAKNI